MKLRISELACCALLVPCLGAALNALGQCSRLDKSKSPLFITFERVVEDGGAPGGDEYRTQALLRLRNNTDCVIIVPSNEEGNGGRFNFPGRERKPERTDAVADGEKIALVYNLNNKRGADGTILVSDGCLVYDRSIGGGESVLFTVPLLHFRKGADVAVQFKYAWEDEGVSLLGGDFGHYAIFRNSLLPGDVSRR